MFIKINDKFPCLYEMEMHNQKKLKSYKLISSQNREMVGMPNKCK